MRRPVEDVFHEYERRGEGAVIVEVPMLDPIPQTQIEVSGLCVEAGVDIIQIPIPVRFPWMYGSRILKIQRAARDAGTWYEQSFDVLGRLVRQYPEAEFMPVGFYGGLQRMGRDAYVRAVSGLGMRLADVPDYPLVHDGDPRGLVRDLAAHGVDYVTVVSADMTKHAPGTRGYQHLEDVLRASHGFCFLLAAAGGKTGEKAEMDYEGLARARKRILDIQEGIGRPCPLVAVCGISTPEQVRTLTHEVGLHVMFGSALFTRMMAGDSPDELLGFLKEMTSAAHGEA